MRGSLGKDGGVSKLSSAPKTCESAAKTAIEWRELKTPELPVRVPTPLVVLTFSPDDQIVPISNTQVQDLYRSREQWLQKDIVVLGHITSCANSSPRKKVRTQQCSPAYLGNGSNNLADARIPPRALCISIKRQCMRREVSSKDKQKGDDTGEGAEPPTPTSGAAWVWSRQCCRATR